MMWTIELVEAQDRWENRLAVTYPDGTRRDVYARSGHGETFRRWADRIATLERPDGLASDSD